MNFADKADHTTPLSIEDSLSNLFNPSVLNLLMQRLGINEHNKPEDFNKIILQLKLVAILAGPGNGNIEIITATDGSRYEILTSHHDLALMVFLAHLVDDAVDQIILDTDKLSTEDHIAKIQDYLLFRKKILMLTQHLVEVYPNSDRDPNDRINLAYTGVKNILTCFINNSSINEIWDLLESKAEIYSFKQSNNIQAFQINFLMVILVGFRLTENKSKELSKLIYGANYMGANTVAEQDNLQTKYFSLFTHPLFVEIASQPGGVEFLYSTCSAVLLLFVSVTDTYIDSRVIQIYELLNGLMGPLVFLDSIATEQVNGSILFLDAKFKNERRASEPTTTEQYSGFIKECWNALFELIDKLYDNPIYKDLLHRILVHLCLVHLALLNTGSAHTYMTLNNINLSSEQPTYIDHSGLQDTYQAIYDKIIASGKVTKQEIEEFFTL